MWILLLNQEEDCVIDPINVSRTLDFVDLSMLKGRVASDCLDDLRGAVIYLTPKDKSDKIKMRFSDAKSHGKQALAKNMRLSDRLATLFEAWDILWGQENFYVPSSGNTVAVLDKLSRLFKEFHEAIVDVR